MKIKLVTYLISVGIIILTLIGTCRSVSADSWEYGPLNDRIASSNAGGTKYDTYRQVGLSVDDKNVYIYVSMDPYKYASDDPNFNTGDNGIQLTGYVLNAANQTIYIDSHSYDFYQLQYSSQNGTKSFPLDIYNSTKGTNVHIENSVTVDHLVRDNGNRVNNIMRLIIPISALNIGEVPAKSTIILSNSNIWQGQVPITLMGASTGPWLLVVIGIVIAAIAYFKLQHTEALKINQRQHQYAY